MTTEMAHRFSTPAATSHNHHANLIDDGKQAEPYEILEDEITQKDDRRENPHIFPSDIPGFGNSILGPRIPFASM